MRRLGPLRATTWFGRLCIRLFGPNSRERFHQDVLQAFDFVFSTHCGVILSYGESYPEAMDAAVIDFAGGHLRLRASCFRGEFSLDVGNRERAIYDWQNANLALPDPGRVAGTMLDYALLVETHWDLLERSLD